MALGEQVVQPGVLILRNSGEHFLVQTEPLSRALLTRQSLFSLDNLKTKQENSRTGSKYTLNSPLQPEL